MSSFIAATTLGGRSRSTWLPASKSVRIELAGAHAPADLPYGQREEDGGSLIFDSPVLSEPLELLGTPVLDLEFSVDSHWP